MVVPKFCATFAKTELYVWSHYGKNHENNLYCSYHSIWGVGGLHELQHHTLFHMGRDARRGSCRNPRRRTAHRMPPRPTEGYRPHSVERTGRRSAHRETGQPRRSHGQYRRYQPFRKLHPGSRIQKSLQALPQRRAYVGKIGEYGTAVGEYKYVYDAQIDEKNGRIYLLPWYGRGILVYRFDGTFEKAIPLHAKYPRLYAPKGIFQVDAENNRIAVVSLPFKNLPHVAWVQDMEGNRMQEIPIAHLKLEPNSSNEVRGSKATDALSFHISPFFELRQDSLYHWDMQQQKLIPRFTIDFGEKPIPLHVYYELPLYYFAEISGTKQMTEDSYVSDRETYFLVDKATLRGSFCHIYNDYLCDEPSDLVIGNNGYFIENVAPDVLKERIETFLQASPDLNEARRQRLLALKDSISENDNNYIIYGKHRIRK